MSEQSINSSYVVENTLIKNRVWSFSYRLKSELEKLRGQIIENGSAKLLNDYDTALARIDAEKFSAEIQAYTDNLNKEPSGKTNIVIGLVVMSVVVPWIMGMIDIFVRLVK